MRNTEVYIMETLLQKICHKGSAWAPRINTDQLFPLPSGSVSSTGYLNDAIKYVEKIQLMDSDLWALFVNQFRQGNVDDHDKGWRGEYWGKMMRGACFCYQCTGDEKLYAAMEATVRDMLSVQGADGRFSTYSVEKQLDGWDIWGRKYILLGMQYFMEICPDEDLKKQILPAICRHADALMEKIGPEEEGKKEINKATNFWYGLNSSSVLEPFVRLYTLTKEQKYLDFAAYIVSRGGCDAGNIFELALADEIAPYEYPVTKAYEMMSCFEGLLEYYRVTGIEKWKEAVIKFAHKVAATDITVIGCAGCTHELFDHSAVRQLDIEEKGIMQETCVTVTWMKLCWQLLCITGDSFFADEMEKSLYNAMLGAINTNGNKHNGGLPFDSYSPLLPGIRGRKMGGYKEMENGTYYGCCACIGAAGLGLPGLSAVMAAKDGLYANFYLNGVVSTLTPGGQAITLTTETKYPAENTVKMALKLEKAEAFTLALRIPAWSKETHLSVNGECMPCQAGAYAAIARKWKDGDEILLTLDFAIRPILPEDYGVSSAQASYMALRRGPLVLARDARLNDDVDSHILPKFNEKGEVEAEILQNPPFPAMIYLAIPQADGPAIPMVDYSSAGKTWAEDSRMCAWFWKK